MPSDADDLPGDVVLISPIGAENNLMELPMQESTAGYEAYEAEKAKLRKDFQDKWKLPFGVKVRLQLKGRPQEIEGTLRQDHGIESAKGELRLILGTIRFHAGQIEYVIRA